MPSPRTIALASTYAEQAETMLEQYTLETGHLVGCPAEALTGIIRQMGWGLRFRPLPEDRWAHCLTQHRLIEVANDLHRRLEYPEQARPVAHALIAHELGHAVLHSAPRRSRRIPAGWEFEARLWSQVFLVPYRLLAGKAEVRALRGNCLTMRERWARAHQLAADFQVTPSFMVSALVLYGVVERTSGGGFQAPEGVLVSAARAS
jgi:hypothetical protein